jgi:hypothetical protein
LRAVESYRQAGFTDVVLMLFGGGDAAVAGADVAATMLPLLRELG